MEFGLCAEPLNCSILHLRGMRLKIFQRMFKMKRKSFVFLVKQVNKIVNSLAAVSIFVFAMTPFACAATGFVTPEVDPDTGVMSGNSGDGTHILYYYDMDKADSAEVQNWTFTQGLSGVLEMSDPVNGVVPDEQTLRDVEEILMAGYPSMTLIESVFPLSPLKNVYYTPSLRESLAYDITQRVAYNRLCGGSGFTNEDVSYFETTYGSHVMHDVMIYEEALLDESYGNTLTTVNQSFWLINADQRVVEDISLHEIPDGTYQSEPFTVDSVIEGASISEINMPEGLELKPLAFSDNGEMGLGDYFVLSFDTKRWGADGLKSGLEMTIDFDALETLEVMSFLPEGYSPFLEEPWQTFADEVYDMPKELCLNLLTRGGNNAYAYDWLDTNDELAGARDKASVFLVLLGDLAEIPWPHLVTEMFIEDYDKELAEWCEKLTYVDFSSILVSNLAKHGASRENAVNIARAFNEYTDFLKNTVFQPETGVVPEAYEQKCMDISADFLKDDGAAWDKVMNYGSNPRLAGVAVSPYRHSGILHAPVNLIKAESPVITTTATTKVTVPKTTTSKTTKAPKPTTAAASKTTVPKITTYKTTSSRRTTTSSAAELKFTEPSHPIFEGGAAGINDGIEETKEETSKTSKTSKSTTAKTAKTTKAKSKTAKTSTSLSETVYSPETTKLEMEATQVLTNESYWEYSVAMSESAAGKKLEGVDDSDSASKVGVTIMLTATGAAVLGVSKNYRHK